jgi:hypothetical protein
MTPPVPGFTTILLLPPLPIDDARMKKSAAEIVREYGPFPGVEQVNGVTYDGQNVWFSTGQKLTALDPERKDGAVARRRRARERLTARTCFRSRRIAFRRSIRQPRSRRSRPGGGGDSGLAGGGSLWVGSIGTQDPPDRSRNGSDSPHDRIQPLRHRGHLGRRRAWHGTWEGDESDLRRIDPQTGEVLEQLEMPPGVFVSGLESDGGDRFFCGGGRAER